MLKLFKPMFEIAFFKRGPDSLPANNAYLGLMLVAYIIATCVAYMIAKLPMRQLLPSLVLSVLAYGVLTYVPLNLAKKPERMRQTFAAFVGADVIITVLMFPALFLLVSFPQESLAYQLGQASFLMTIVWSIVVIAVILNDALEWQKVFGFMIAPVYFFTLVMIGEMMFGAGG